MPLLMPVIVSLISIESSYRVVDFVTLPILGLMLHDIVC